MRITTKDGTVLELFTDNENFILRRYYKPSEKNKGDTESYQAKYYSNLEYALKSMLNYSLLNTDRTNFNILLNELRKSNENISNNIQGIEKLYRNRISELENQLEAIREKKKAKDE